MSEEESHIHGQNIVACVWDFDKTLIPDEGEFLLFNNGSIIKARLLKINKDKVLVDVQGQEKELPLKFIRGISFHGCKYIGPQQTPGLMLQSGRFIESPQVYFTRTMLGCSKPLKARLKKFTACYNVCVNWLFRDRTTLWMPPTVVLLTKSFNSLKSKLILWLTQPNTMARVLPTVP